MSSRPQLSLPPIGAIRDPAVISAMHAISGWARNVSNTMLTSSDVDGGAQSMVGQRIVRAAENAVATSLRKSRYVPIQKTPANIVREIIENSGTEPPMVFNAPHVFQAGGSTTGVFLGAGGMYGYNSSYIVAGNADGKTFGITAADGSFFFGPRVVDTDPDPERRQIIFDAATGVFQFGQDIVIQYSGGTKTLGEVASSTYTTANLDADLAAGVGRILSGFGTGYVADFNPDMAYIVMGREGGVYDGYSSVADTTNTNLPALAITADGIAMGYNSGIDGAWHNAVAILADGTAYFSGTINATDGNFTGTVTAGSVIAETATVGGVALGTVSSNAALGAAASAAMGTKLEAGTSYVLTGAVSVQNTGGIKTGTIAWDAVTGALTSGTGVAITENGIVGALAGVPKFTLTTAGDATFAGTLAAAYGTIAAVELTSAGYLRGGQTDYATGDGIFIGASSGVYKLSVGRMDKAVTGINLSTNVFTLANHGFASGSFLRFSDVGTITGISPYVEYRVINATQHTFQINSDSVYPTTAVDLTGTTTTLPTVLGNYLTYDGNRFDMRSANIAASGSAFFLGGGDYGLGGLFGYGLHGESIDNSGTGVRGWCLLSGGIGVDCRGSNYDAMIGSAINGSSKLGFKGGAANLRYDGAAFRVTDSYSTDAWMLMITAASGASSTGATMAAKPAAASANAQAGWLTVKVNGATAYIPYWQ